MITELIYTLLFSLIAGRLIYAVPVLICLGLITKKILSLVPESEGKKKQQKIVLVVSLFFSALSFVTYGFTLPFIRSAIIYMIFAYASMSDISARHLDNFVSIMLFISGFIGITMTEIWINGTGALIAGLFLLASAIISNGKLGGADVKFIPACFFVLGPLKGIFSLSAALLLAVVSTLIRNKICNITDREEKKKLPLLPYISLAAAAAYIL